MFILAEELSLQLNRRLTSFKSNDQHQPPNGHSHHTLPMVPEAVSTTSSGGADHGGWDSGLSSTTDTNGGAADNFCGGCVCQNGRSNGGNGVNDDW